LAIENDNHLAKVMNHTITFFSFAMVLLAGCPPDKNESATTAAVAQNSTLTSAPANRIGLTACIGGTSYKDTSLIIHVCATIENLSSDTVVFGSMTCSYEDLFVVNDSNYQVQSRFDCYKNGPCFISLPPKAKTDRYLLIRQTGSQSVRHNNPIKVGMKLILSENDLHTGHSKMDSNVIIWSNELQMNRLYKGVYYE
jgi:hypothetical protein